MKILLLASLFLMPSLATGATVLIGSGTNNGNFNEDTYRQALSLQRLTDAQVREDLGIGLLSGRTIWPLSLRLGPPWVFSIDGDSSMP